MRRNVLPIAVAMGLASLVGSYAANAQTVVVPELALPAAPAVTAPAVAAIGPPMPGTTGEQKPDAAQATVSPPKPATSTGSATTTAAASSVAAKAVAAPVRKERVKPVRVARARAEAPRVAYYGREVAARAPAYSAYQAPRAAPPSYTRDVGRFWPPAF
jgi:hypothetical protein